MTEEQARALFLEHCQPGDRGALERHGEKAAVAAILAATTLHRDALIDSLSAELSGTYDCTRVWEAWGIGTMGQDDFQPTAWRVEEIADAMLAEREKGGAK